MEIQINQVIGLNKLQYLNMVTNQFNVWCEHLSNTYYVPMRELQTNSMLYNWFLKQWDIRIVNPFLKEHKGLLLDSIEMQDTLRGKLLNGTKASDTFFELFTDILDSPNAMIGIYPAPILQRIKKKHYKTISNK